MQNRLFQLRENSNFTQKEIANKFGISRQLYSSWETGKRTIPLKRLNDICNYYNTSMDYVLLLSNKKENNNTNKVNMLNKKEIGDRIRLIRENNNLTLRQLATELNTTSSTISAYETSKTLILTEFAFQICKKYNLSLDWLCCRN